MNNEVIVNSIKTLCKKNSITVNQLEKEVGLSQGLVSKWMNTTPSLDKIIDIADYFHISLDEVVGRDKNNINDEFIRVLYDKTTNKEINWRLFNSSEDESGIIQYREEVPYFSPTERKEYEEFCETHKQISYYFEYMHGYISIYAMYEYRNVTTPNELKLFIQPDIKAELIEQPFEKSELLPLWLKILISLEDEAPDEIRAEELKNSFIYNVENKTLSDNRNEINAINQILGNPKIEQLIEIMNTPEMLKIRETFANPEFQTTIQTVNRLYNYYKKIK